MSIVLTQYLETLATERTPLWIDGWDYGQAVLARGGQPPWADVGEFVAWHRQLQSLVSSDVVVIELASFYHCWLAQSPALKDAMAAKKRLGYALRTLLADPASRAYLREIVEALGSLYSDRPVLLALPSPRQWMAIAYCQAHGVNEVEVSWDDAESAAMYAADYLRNFAGCPIAGLLLRDIAGPANDEETARYQPVLNVAEHYRWQVVLDGCSGQYRPGPAQGVTYCLADSPGEQRCPKTALDTWSGPAEFKPAFWYLQIPPTAVPESVLESLQAVRADTTTSH